jgi:folylpolyglutamate synthase/dihydropteroate synthase
MLEQNQKPVGFCITSMVYGHESLPFYKQLVDLVDEFVVVPIDFHRAKKVDELASEISVLGKPVSKFKSLQEGIDYVMGKTCYDTSYDKSVLITGSFYLVGESLRVLKS